MPVNVLSPVQGIAVSLSVFSFRNLFLFCDEKCNCINVVVNFLRSAIWFLPLLVVIVNVLMFSLYVFTGTFSTAYLMWYKWKELGLWRLSRSWKHPTKMAFSFWSLLRLSDRVSFLKLRLYLFCIVFHKAEVVMKDFIYLFCATSTLSCSFFFYKSRLRRSWRSHIHVTVTSLLCIDVFSLGQDVMEGSRQ